MKNFPTLIGWLLLAAILAVPSFLYYNWSSNKKKDEARLVSVQSVSAATIFSSAPAASASLPQSFPQPHPPKADAPAAEPSAGKEEGPIVPVSVTAPRTDSPVSAVQASTAAARAGTTQSAAAVEASTSTAVSALGGPVSTQTALASYYDPKSDRDPTITPAEYRKMKQEEALRREEERQRQLLLSRQQREVGGESRITLQGIVGNSVIINGEVYSVGNTVHGVKLLKIGSNYVIGEYKGKRFRKVLQ